MWLHLLRPVCGIPDHSIQASSAGTHRLPEQGHQEVCSQLGEISCYCIFLGATDPTVFYVLCQRILKCGTKEMTA